MQEIIIRIDAKGRISSTRSLLGREGENESIRMLIDTSRWITDYPEFPFFSMNVQKGANEWTAFAGRVRDASGVVEYIADALLFADANEIQIQIEASSNDIRIRTDMLTLKINDSISPATPPSSDFPAWYQEMLEAANELGGQVVDAKEVLKESTDTLGLSDEKIVIMERLVQDATLLKQETDIYAESAKQDAYKAADSEIAAKHWAEQSAQFFDSVTFTVNDSGELSVVLPDAD